MFQFESLVGLCPQKLSLLSNLTCKRLFYHHNDAACPQQVFMLSSQQALDEQTMLQILESGHSRIPIHKPDRRCLLPSLSCLSCKSFVKIKQSCYCRVGRDLSWLMQLEFPNASCWQSRLLLLQGWDCRSTPCEGAYHCRQELGVEGRRCPIAGLAIPAGREVLLSSEGQIAICGSLHCVLIEIRSLIDKKTYR